MGHPETRAYHTGRTYHASAAKVAPTAISALPGVSFSRARREGIETQVSLDNLERRRNAGVVGGPDQRQAVEDPVRGRIGPQEVRAESVKITRAAEEHDVDPAFVVGGIREGRVRQQLLVATGADDLAAMRLEPGVRETGADEGAVSRRRRIAVGVGVGVGDATTPAYSSFIGAGF